MHSTGTQITQSHTKWISIILIYYFHVISKSKVHLRDDVVPGGKIPLHLMCLIKTKTSRC